MNREDFEEVLKKRGMVENCRNIWWKHWEPYQAKFGGNKELLERLVTEVTEKAVKPLAVYKSRGFIFWSFSAIMRKLLEGSHCASSAHLIIILEGSHSGLSAQT